MSDFRTFLDSIGEPDQKARMESILKNMKEKFPQLGEHKYV